MAKKPKAPPGVAQMSEKEFSEMVASRNPKSQTLDKVLNKLAAENARSNVSSAVKPSSATKIAMPSKVETVVDNVKKQEEAKTLKETANTNQKLLDSDENRLNSDKELHETDKELLTVEKDLSKSLEKFIKVLEDNLLRTGQGVGPVTPKARAQELVDSKKLDYRTIGERFKDKIFGRGGVDKDGKRLGNAYDTESLRYKFGSLKGLAETTGLVKRDSTGFIANAIAKRHERKQTAEEMTNLNPQMKNLDQFQVKDPITGERDTSEAGLKASREKVKEYYEKETGKAQVATGKLQDKEAVLNKARFAGIAEDEIERTVGGKQALEARNIGADEVIKLDPRMRGEKLENEQVRRVREAEAKRESSPKMAAREQLTPFAGPAARLADEDQATSENYAENKRQMDEQTTLLNQIEKNTRSDSTKKDNKKKDSDNKEGEKEGGVLSRMKDKAASFLEKKGLLPKGLGKVGSTLMQGGKGLLGKGAGLLRGASALGGAATAAGGTAAAGGAAAAGGTAAAGGAAAAGGGMLAAGGAALTAAAPWILGAAAVGAVGYLGYKGYQKWKEHKAEKATQAKLAKNKDKSKLEAIGDSAKPQVKSTTIKESGEYNLSMDPDTGKFMANGKEISGEEYTKLQNMPMGMDKVRAIKAAADGANKVASSSAENDSMKYSGNKEGDKTLVNAPTNINKVTQNSVAKRPARSSEWYENRHRYKGMVPNVSF